MDNSWSCPWEHFAIENRVRLGTIFCKIMLEYKIFVTDKTNYMSIHSDIVQHQVRILQFYVVCLSSAMGGSNSKFPFLSAVSSYHGFCLFMYNNAQEIRIIYLHMYVHIVTVRCWCKWKHTWDNLIMCFVWHIIMYRKY